MTTEINVHSDPSVTEIVFIKDGKTVEVDIQQDSAACMGAWDRDDHCAAAIAAQLARRPMERIQGQPWSGAESAVAQLRHRTGMKGFELGMLSGLCQLLSHGIALIEQVSMHRKLGLTGDLQAALMVPLIRPGNELCGSTTPATEDTGPIAKRKRASQLFNRRVHRRC